MTQRIDLPRTVVFALCGSFCTFGAVLPQIQALVGRGWQVLPALSWAAARQDTRSGTAESWRRQLTELTGHAPIDTLQQAEPLGPRRMACATARTAASRPTTSRAGRPAAACPPSCDTGRLGVLTGGCGCFLSACTRRASRLKR